MHMCQLEGSRTRGLHNPAALRRCMPAMQRIDTEPCRAAIGRGLQNFKALFSYCQLTFKRITSLQSWLSNGP